MVATKRMSLPVTQNEFLRFGVGRRSDLDFVDRVDSSPRSPSASCPSASSVSSVSGGGGAASSGAARASSMAAPAVMKKYDSPRCVNVHRSSSQE